MHERVLTFVECARAEYDIDPEVVEFPDGTKTAADAAAAIGCETAQIASSLVFEADGRLVISVTSGANRVSEAVLADHFGVPTDAVSMADPDRVREEVGWTIGGVPPICHETAVPVVFDETLLEHDEVWTAAGTPTAVFPIESEQLAELTDAAVISVTG